jgi:hypothetical protein
VTGERTRAQRLFGAACLKLTLEKTSGVGAEELDIYAGALRDLELTEDEVDRFLDEHSEEVLEALKSSRPFAKDQTAS